MKNNTPPPHYIRFLKRILLFAIFIFSPIILFAQNDEEETVEYFNDCGTATRQVVYKKEKITQDIQPINLTAYEDGVYFVLLSGENNYSKRLILKK